MDGVGGGQEAYAAAVDGQKQERQRTVISHQCSKSRHIQAKVLWGQRRGCQVSLPWALSVPPVRISASREPSLAPSVEVTSPQCGAGSQGPQVLGQ